MKIRSLFTGCPSGMAPTRPPIPFVLALSLALILVSACAAVSPRKPPALAPTDRGTVIYLDQYEFQRPPAGWALMRNLEGGDFELGFLRIEGREFPSQTTFFYDDQPFGNSRDLDRRAEQYRERFLFNSGIFPEVRRKEKVRIAGREALAIEMEGENPGRGEKARSKVYLIQKGERIVSLVCTQWRPLRAEFDPQSFAFFEAFAGSFKFLKPDFYEELNEKIKGLGGS